LRRGSRVGKAIVVTMLCFLAAILVASELAFRLATAPPAAPPPGRGCAVLVLGYPSRADGSPDPIQQSRVAAGVATLNAFQCGTLVLSGGAAHNAFVEADAMAGVARGLGVADDRIALERRARDTWENVALSLPWLEGRGAFYVVSEALHARRGVRYLCRQRSDLCALAQPVAAPLPFWWKPLAAAYELRKWLGDRATPRGAPG
jgi:uncharacterized SAM-binding protein YcdF (DUF218 family)